MMKKIASSIHSEFAQTALRFYVESKVFKDAFEEAQYNTSKDD